MIAFSLIPLHPRGRVHMVTAWVQKARIAYSHASLFLQPTRLIAWVQRGFQSLSLSLSIIASVTHHLYLSLPTPSCSLSFCLSPCLSRARIIVDRIQYVFGFDMFSPSSSTSSLTLSPSPILRHGLKALLHNRFISSPVCTSVFKEFLLPGYFSFSFVYFYRYYSVSNFA